MFEIGWTELLLIGVVALIVIGPKDLPDMFRTMGRFTAKARSMARDFQRAMDQAVDQTGVKDMANDIRSATSAKSMGLNAVKEAATKFEKWDPLKPATTKPVLKPVVDPSAPVVDAPAPAAAPVAPSMGPATQALADKQAERAAIARDAADKLRLARTAQVATDKKAVATKKPRAPKPKNEAPAAEVAPVPKPRATKPRPAPEAKPAPKPRAPRKTTSSGDA